MASEFEKTGDVDPLELEQVLFCFAVEQEAEYFFEQQRNLCLQQGRKLSSLEGMEVLITGIGRENAERKLHAALREEPYQLVVSCGFAGGLNPYLTAGTVVFSADEDAGLTPALLKVGACPVRFHCSDRVAITVEEKQKLWESTGADAVEMESSIIRAICRVHSIPSATIRVISDGANDNLPLDFNALMTADQHLNYGRLLLALVTSPGKIPALLRLQRQTKLAAKNLADVLTRVISCQD